MQNKEIQFKEKIGKPPLEIQNQMKIGRKQEIAIRKNENFNRFQDQRERKNISLEIRNNEKKQSFLEDIHGIKSKMKELSPQSKLPESGLKVPSFLENNEAKTLYEKTNSKLWLLKYDILGYENSNTYATRKINFLDSNDKLLKNMENLNKNGKVISNKKENEYLSSHKKEVQEVNILPNFLVNFYL